MALVPFHAHASTPSMEIDPQAPIILALPAPAVPKIITYVAAIPAPPAAAPMMPKLRGTGKGSAGLGTGRAPTRLRRLPREGNEGPDAAALLET